MATLMTALKFDLSCTHPLGSGGIFPLFTAVYSMRPSFKKQNTHFYQFLNKKCCPNRATKSSSYPDLEHGDR